MNESRYFKLNGGLCYATSAPLSPSLRGGCRKVTMQAEGDDVLETLHEALETVIPYSMLFRIAFLSL